VAKTRKFAAPRGLSRWLASDTGFPVSASPEIVEALLDPFDVLRRRSTRACNAILPKGLSARPCRAHRGVHHRAVGFVNLATTVPSTGLILGNCPAADELAVDVALALGTLMFAVMKLSAEGVAGPGKIGDTLPKCNKPMRSNGYR
jgi:hypothetical protein